VKTILTKQKNKAKKVNKKRDITQTLSYIQYEVAGDFIHWIGCFISTT